jgi:hypothetical protein
MKALKVTSNGADGHYHIVFINSETGAMMMSPAEDGHSHEGMFDPPREPTEEQPAVAVDPNTGEQIEVPNDPAQLQELQAQGYQVTPGVPADEGKETGDWIIRPGGEDMHTHPELMDYVPKRPKKTTEVKDDEKIKKALAGLQECIELKQCSQDRGHDAEEMYFGNQWDKQTKDALLANDLAALTLNEIMPNIDTLIGYQMEERTDIKYLPQGGGDERAAELYSVAVKRILDNCGYQREESKFFKDMIVPGMGVLNIYVDVEKDVRGTPIVERFPWDRAWYGAHEKDDLSDCEVEYLEAMRSLAQLKKAYPRKADEIEQSYANYAGRYPDVDNKDSSNGTGTDYRSARKADDYPQTIAGTYPLVDTKRKQFRLIQMTEKVYREVTVVYNEEEDFIFSAYDWDPKDVKRIESIPGFDSLSQIKTRYRILRFCGNVVLSDEDPADLPNQDFHTVVGYAYRQNGEFLGKVEIAKDPQRELNKRRSQLMDLMNRLGASVYYTTPETFLTPGEKERFKRQRSKPGAVFEVAAQDLKPEREDGAALPPGVAAIMQLDQENLQRLMNIVVTQTGANEPGSLFLEKKKGVLTGNKFLMDNLAFAKQRLGKLMVGMVKRYYDPERLQELLNSSYQREKFKIAGVDYADYTTDEILEILNDANQMEFDVIVTESSFSASTRIDIAKMLFELMGKGMLSSPELPLEFLDMPQDVRIRITQGIQQQNEAAAQEAKQTSDTEIKKTIIAKGQYTVSPEEAAEMGLVPVNNPLPEGEASSNPQIEEPAQEFALEDALVAG